MKKLFLLIAVAAMSVTAAAQEKSIWGVRAGINISGMSVVDGSDALKTRFGYQLGVAYQRPLLGGLPLYLESGLYFTTRSAKYKTGDETAKLNGHYLQIPAALSWHFNIKEFSLQPLVGIYYSLGIAGTQKVGDEKIDLFSKSDHGDGGTYKPFKRSDFGLRFGVNCVFKKHYHVGLGYERGLLNVGKNFAGNSRIKAHNFYINVGYNF